VNRTIKSLAKRAPVIKPLLSEILKQGPFRAGHYHSPIPEAADVRRYVESRNVPGYQIPGINLDERHHFEMINEYIGFYPDISFPEQKAPHHRYYYRNVCFNRSDAIFLYCFLRKHRPGRIVEIGAGFSSAVMLDTIDRCYFQMPEITFIEPDPARLISLFENGDRGNTTLIDQRVEDARPEVLLDLDAGDLLFIDSSHVLKCASDLHYLMFEIMPKLKRGVFVHFHDVFYPFDYPDKWLLDGWYWNEAYMLRAFLAYNSVWSIEFFSDYARFMFGDLIREKMPLCSERGASLYLVNHPINSSTNTPLSPGSA